VTIVRKIKAVYQRLERAEEIVEKGLIRPLYGTNGWYVCKSHSGQQDGNGQAKLYLVTGESCTCKDYQELQEYNGGWCKHRLAREILLEGKEAGDDPDRVSDQGDGDTKPARRRGARGPSRGNRRRAHGARSATGEAKAGAKS
jgi:hypothetical protein